MPKSTISRRHWLRTAGANALSLGLADGCGAYASEREEPGAEPLAPLNRFPRTVHEYYVARVRERERAARAELGKLKTKADAEGYVAAVREKIARCFGPFPEKTPLNPKVVGRIERDTYAVEKVIFESRPKFYVTANLYLPTGYSTPRPGVVGSCGHSTNGKADPAYQSFCQGLARMGYAVLIFDPIGQGERLQYAHLKRPGRPSVGVGEHLHAGNQQFLVGEFFGSWRAWDGIRALDYLLSRPEVDPKHVGITGNSGGGTMTTWLCGLDPRYTMAAPSCFVTAFRRNLENELPADTEQCPPHAIALGLNHADFLAAMAPKPVAVLAKERDFFDVRGAEEAYRHLQRIYELLGAAENVALFIGPSEHGFSRENREAMYRWFNRATGVSEVKGEPKLAIEKDETLRCTAAGQIDDPTARSVFSFTREIAQRQAENRAELQPGALAKLLESALKMPARTGIPEYRILRPSGDRKYPKPHATAYAVETEPGIVAVVYQLSDRAHLARPPRDQSPALLYISHHSADAELRDEPLIAQLIANDPAAAVFACDVRGVGETRPNTCGGTNQFLTPYGNDYFYAIHGLMLDSPYPGQKTHDVLRVLDWIASFGHRSVHLVAKGWGTIPAAFAAILAANVAKVTLKNAPTAYGDIAQSELYSWPLSAFLPSALPSFDLPDCYRALATKQMKLIDPVGPNGKIV